MVPRWIDRTPQRPDRYLDWLTLNRRTGDADGWCSVLLQLQVAAGKNPAAHLEKLLAELTAGADAGSSATILALPAELKLVESRIRELKRKTYVPSGDEDAGLSFFVYMPESRIYAGGDFAHKQHYRIRFAGPPIPGFDCERASEISAPPAKAPKHTGSSVAIGVIDHAIAFANERFREKARAGNGGAVERSRVRRLWIQDIERAGFAAGGAVVFGRQLTDGDINKAIERSAARTGVVNESSVYAETGAVSFDRALHQATAWRAGHGTHVLDVAAGYDPADPAGANRPILAVQLPEAVTHETSGVTLASYVLQALRQIMHWADTIEAAPLPLVVNFSYGLYAGPKNGMHLIEREIARLVDHRNRMHPDKPTVVVVPSGNFYRERVTARLSLAPGEKQALDWVILPDSGTPSFLEIWTERSGSGPPVSVTLASPGGIAGPLAPPANGVCKVLVDDDNPVCAVTYDAEGGVTGSPLARVLVAVNPTRSFSRRTPLAPSGCWTVTVENTSSRSRDIDLYIQRQDTVPGDEPPGRQSYFDHQDAFGRDEVKPEAGNLDSGDYDQLLPRCPIKHEGSLSALATHRGLVVVGAAMAARDSDQPQPARYTSSGPVKSREGPDFAAVADLDRAHLGTIAAGTRSGSAVILTGTSIAAPQITRALADVGGDLRRLKQKLGVSATAPRDPRTGWAIVGDRVRPDIPRRRRPH